MCEPLSVVRLHTHRDVLTDSIEVSAPWGRGAVSRGIGLRSVSIL